MIAHFDHPYFSERCREFGIESFSLPKRSLFKRISTLPLFAIATAQRMRAQGVSLLHSHLFGPIVGGSISASVARIPHVGTLHDVHMIEESPSRIRQIDLALALGTRLVAVSEQMASYYRERVRWRRERILCIHNGIDPLPSTSEATGVRDQLGIPHGDIVAIIVGRLVPLKRIQDALLALRAALEVQRLTLLVVGEGPELESLRSLAAQLGISSSIRLLGARRDVPNLLRSADMFIQCSETEGLSMSIIEALHAGLPCIVTDVGGNRELVKDNGNGVCVQVGDLRALANWMIKLAADRKLRNQMGTESRKLALRYFTGEAMLQKYLTLYRDLGVPARERAPDYKSSSVMR